MKILLVFLIRVYPRKPAADLLPEEDLLRLIRASRSIDESSDRQFVLTREDPLSYHLSSDRALGSFVRN